MIVLLLATALACPPGELTTALDRAEQAFLEDDAAAGVAEVGAAVASLDCIDQIVPKRDAARLHGVLGLAAHAAGDDDGLRRHLAAARAAYPGYSFPAGRYPTDHPVYAAFFDAADVYGDTEALRYPRGVRLFLDGAEGRTRPTERPVIFQVLHGQVGEAGPTVSTTLMGPGDATPDYPSAAPRYSARNNPERSWAWVGYAGAGALAGGGGLLLMRSQSLRTETMQTAVRVHDGMSDEVQALKRQSNTHLVAGYAAVGVGALLGLGTATGLVPLAGDSPGLALVGRW